MTALQAPIRWMLEWLELLFDKPFGPPWNPVRQSGTLAFFFFWVSAVTGIYVYILFDTSVDGAFASVEYMTREQWYLAGVMRSMHRYASDAMVVTMALHLVREFSLDRYRGVRWFSWFTGLPVIVLLFVSGISGYWLVWDELAQYVAIGSMEWFDWLGIFGEPVANNFLTSDSLNDRFFSLLVFIHIFGPLFLLFMMWVHILRINGAKTNPPRGLALGSLAMLVVVSVAYPAVSHAPADLGTVPLVLDLDWYFMFLYPLFDIWGPGAMWALAFGGSLVLCAMPWLPPLKGEKSATVFLEQCNGCTRCFDDCPYGAIVMQPRTDGRPFEKEAVVDADLCTGCGICVGACPMSTPFRQGKGKGRAIATGIDLPGGLSLDQIHERMTNAIQAAQPARGPDTPGILVVGCDHGAPTKALAGGPVQSVSLPCIGMLPPSFIDFALSNQRIDGVVLTGCSNCDCFNRQGIQWTEARLAGLRDPYLRKRVPRDRVHVFWAGPGELGNLGEELGRFSSLLARIPVKTESTIGGSKDTGL